MEILKGVELFGGIGSDSNTYVIDGEIIVDTGTGSYFPSVKREIEGRGHSSNLIINTHCHFDHSGGNKKFRDWLKAEIAVHKDDKDAVEGGTGTLSEMFGEKSRIITVDRALGDGDRIKTENFRLEVIHTPGHTAGSICLYEKNSRVLISGDTLFSDGIGRTDLPSGSSKALYESLKKLSRLDILYLLPGHGTPKIRGIDFLLKQMMVFSEA